MGNSLTHRCRGRFADEAASALPDPPLTVVHRRALLLRAGHLVLRKQKENEVVMRIPIFMSPTYIVVVKIINFRTPPLPSSTQVAVTHCEKNDQNFKQ